MRVTSTLTDVQEIGPIPIDKYICFVVSKEDRESRENKNPMVVLDWEVAEGEYKGRQVRFDNIVLGGFVPTKDGRQKKVVPAQLCRFLHATKTPWRCLSCNSAEEPRDFYFGTGPEENGGDGRLKGKPFCPECMSDTLDIEYDTDNFKGAKGLLSIGQQKEQKGDRMFNTVEGYSPLP